MSASTISGFILGLMSGPTIALAASPADASAPDAALANLLRPLVHMLSTDAPSITATLWLLTACLAVGGAWVMLDHMRQGRHGAPTPDHSPPRPLSAQCPGQRPGQHAGQHSAQSRPTCTA
ncbi:hypothetical protein DA2_2707 [Desulfovibrio sp. A2]|nr:hypothetical protein DA2_2707 [Desulfovibrio sp. A2]